MLVTKKGDKGESLLQGKGVGKDSELLEALGTLDELGSWLGLLRAQIKQWRLKKVILKIQQELQEISAQVAGYKEEEFSEEKIKFLEQQIDKWWSKLPPLSGFIIVGETETEAFCHIARTVCRRAERRVVALSKKKKIPDSILAYLNRLSDFLFVLARWID